MTPFSPLVSIIIPTRNRKGLLLYAIQSVLQQTYSRLQIIVHDNNSSDGTKEFVAEKIQDPRIEFHQTDHDLVMTENWNAAFGFVKGEYVVRLDDDNIFLPGFIEHALKEIEAQQLDVFSASPLIIHLDRRVFPLFTPENTTYRLDKFQSLYLEYRALTDSNYTMYRTALIRQLFPDGRVYRSTLPDRFMNYTIADSMDRLGWRVGVSPQIQGVTRFDYRDSFPTDYTLRYVDYRQVSRASVKQEMNVHNNFSIHRIMTIQEFFETAHDQSLQRFFSQVLTRPTLFLTVMQLGHVQRIRSLHSFREWLVYIRYYGNMARALLRAPRAAVEGGPAWKLLFPISRALLQTSLATLRNLVTRTHQAQPIADPTFGESLINKFLTGQAEVSAIATISPVYGSFNSLLEQVRLRTTEQSS